MGVVHKLKPEVLSFIIENKKNNPALSCRNLTALILEQLKTKVSKSSINAIFKENNLSMPIGRRCKQKKKKFNLSPLPVIEGTKAVTLVAPQISPEKTKEEIIPEQKKEEINPDEKRLKEAEEWAIRLQEEERIRAEEKLIRERQRLQEEAKKAVVEALQAAAENKRKQEEARKLEEEKAALEAELKAEKERWAKLAEADRNSQPPANQEETILPKVELAAGATLPQDRVCSGAIILKALDCLIGGSREINAAINRAIGGRPEESLKLTEALIFKSLFGKDNFPTLGDLIGVQYSPEQLNSYFAQIKQITGIGLDATKIISAAFTEAKGVKVHFVDGSIIHLDGQLHSSWPATRFPLDFSNTLGQLKNSLNKYFFQDQPLVLFSPVGYDVFPKDFFSLILNISSKDNYPVSLTLFGDQQEELESLALDSKSRRGLVFGLWPWQFTSSRKVKKIGEFSLKHIKEIERDLYLGEIEVDLFRASLNQSLTLKGCAVKTDLKEKIRLVIFSNNEQAVDLAELAGIYLSRWPNFEEAFQDFSRKIELFTYAGTEQEFFSKNSFGLATAGPAKELAEIFANYIKLLDAYLRWHFLPSGYAERDFSFTSEFFYKIPVKLVAGQDRVRVKMLVSQDYQFLKDLEYLNCRLNERQINTAQGQKLWFESAFK